MLLKRLLSINLPISVILLTIQALADLGREDIIVITGGVIPPQDYDFLFNSESQLSIPLQH